AGEQENARYAELNREFHMTVYEYAHSPLLMSLMRLLWAALHGGPRVMPRTPNRCASTRRSWTRCGPGTPPRPRPSPTGTSWASSTCPGPEAPEPALAPMWEGTSMPMIQADDGVRLYAESTGMTS